MQLKCFIFLRIEPSKSHKMINTIDYNFKVLLLKKKFSQNKSIDRNVDDYHTVEDKKMLCRYNKSSNGTLLNQESSKPKMETLRTNLTASNSLHTHSSLTFANHYNRAESLLAQSCKANLPKRSATTYLSNMNVVLDPIKTTDLNHNPEQIQSIKNFYIKKMADFGFRAFENKPHILLPQQKQARKSPIKKSLSFQAKSSATKTEHVPSLNSESESEIKMLDNSMDKSDLFKDLLGSDYVVSQKSDIQNKSFQDFNSPSFNQKNKSTAKFFSPSLIICKPNVHTFYYFLLFIVLASLDEFIAFAVVDFYKNSYK